MTKGDVSAEPTAPRFGFDGFAEFDFPRQGDIVYVLCFKTAEMTEFTPFYVGESSRHVGRFGDYLTAHFSASTDFKVGRAARRLHELGCEVVVRYRPVTDRKGEERKLIANYEAAGLQLLNRLQGYRYRTASEADEVAKVEMFVKQILCQHGTTALRTPSCA